MEFFDSSIDGRVGAGACPTYQNTIKKKKEVDVEHRVWGHAEEQFGGGTVSPVSPSGADWAAA